MQPPVIDISGLVEETPGALERVARALSEPAADWGAFLVVGHAIADGQRDRFDSAMRRFFAMPLDARRRLRRSRDNARGYYDEELTKNRRDWKEVFDYGAERGAASHSDGVNRWPDDLPGFRDEALAWYAMCERIGRGLLRAIGVSLGLPADTFGPAFERHSSFVRLNHYAPCPNAAAPDSPMFPAGRPLGVHHHTDAGALTIVHQDDVGGLQLWHQGAFQMIEPIEGALVVHMADMLQVWTNDHYRSPLHRVVASKDRSRYSAPFFLNPGYDVVCAPLAGLLAAGDEPLYRPVAWNHFRDQRSAGDYADYGEEIQIEQFRIAGEG